MVLVLNITNNETLFVLHLSLFTLVPIKHTSERRFLTQKGGIDFSLGHFYKVPPGCKAIKYAFNLFFFFALSCTLCEIKREKGYLRISRTEAVVLQRSADTNTTFTSSFSGAGGADGGEQTHRPKLHLQYPACLLLLPASPRRSKSSPASLNL